MLQPPLTSKGGWCNPDLDLVVMNLSVAATYLDSLSQVWTMGPHNQSLFILTNDSLSETSKLVLLFLISPSSGGHSQLLHMFSNAWILVLDLPYAILIWSSQFIHVPARVWGLSTSDESGVCKGEGHSHLPYFRHHASIDVAQMACIP